MLCISHMLLHTHTHTQTLKNQRKIIFSTKIPRTLVHSSALKWEVSGSELLWGRPSLRSPGQRAALHGDSLWQWLERERGTPGTGPSP